MFTKKRLKNLKFISIGLLISVFLLSGLFINTTKTEAAETIRYATVTYSLSEVISTTNSNGDVTTKVLIGCAPGSKDVFDINTGKPCVHFTKTILVGCAPGSGDLYDINTGKSCASKPAPVLASCQPLSGDIYDINTGKRCTNDTSVKPIVSKGETNAISVAKVESIPLNPIVKVPTENSVAQITEINPILNEPIEQINNDDNVSEREKMKSSILASVGRVGSIFNGPMSFWTILLLIVILIAGGYGVYSFLKKEDENTLKPIANPATPKTNNPPTQTVTPGQPYIKTETVSPSPQASPIQNTTVKTPETNTTNPVSPIASK